MYYNEDTIIYFNGEFIKATEARSNVYDQSLHYGYAAFEGIRSYITDNGTRIFKALEHYDRLKFSCEATGIPYPFDNNELIELSYQVLDKNGLGDAYLRPLVSCSPNMALTKSTHSQVMITAWKWDSYFSEKLLNLCTSSIRRISPSSFKVEQKFQDIM